MRSCQQSASEQNSHFGADTALFFLLFYLYVWLIIDPRLVDHAVGILFPYDGLSFTAGWPFFQEHLLRPGGIVEYVARFLSPFFCWAWIGALIVTAVAWATCVSVDALTRLAGRPRGLVARLGPPMLLLALYAGYSQPLRTVLSLLAVLAGFGCYVRLAPRGRAAWTIFVLTLCVVLDYIAGSASVLFPFLVAVYEILVRRKLLAGLAGLFCGLIVPGLLGAALFDQGLRESYGTFLAPVSGVARSDRPYLLALYLVFPVVLAGSALREAGAFRYFVRAKRAPSRKASPSRSTGVLPFLRAERSSRSMKVTAVLLTVAAIAWFIRDPRSKIMLKIDYCSQHEMWPEALNAAAKMPPHQYSGHFNRNVMLALYHAGRLGDEMFCYPQPANAAELYAISPAEDDVPSYLQLARLFLDMGEVNRAERHACEALCGTGDLPALLEQLATINIVKGRPETAKVFLNALSKKPLYHQAAQETLQKLADDPRMEDDPTVSRLRAVMLDRDSVSYSVSVEVMLLELLARNRHNKMAFDFLMVHYLLTGRPEQVVANLQYLKDFGYQSIPRHFQEAVVARASATDDWELTKEYEIPPEVLGQEVLLKQILADAPNKDEAMNAAVAAGLGHSYLFFLEFGRSGF